MANQPGWRKSSYSTLQTDCVEVAPMPGTTGIRDSKNINGGELRAPGKAWTSFIAGVRSGSLTESATR